MTQKTWGGRFSGNTDHRVEEFTESIQVDHRLYRQDIEASKAHARMLAKVELIGLDEAEQICHQLDEIGQEIEQNRFPFSIQLEDIHTHIENALIDRLGDLGRKLHTARSRNDQVVTDTKLWVRDAIDLLDQKLHELQKVLLEIAEKYKDLVLPGYTHLQRAQPILAAHYFLAYIEKFHRDRDRLTDCRKRVNQMPLGIAALAGTSLPIDRSFTASLLDFSEVMRNSLDASSDRDFAAEFLFDLALMAVHLSSWAEEWILWTSTEFQFIDLPDAFCTGSSIMPHKKNPDVLELTRGKSARVISSLQQIFLLLKALPMAYNRDLQEDKPAIFDAFDTIKSILDVVTPLIQQTEFRREVIANRLEDGFLDATTLMEYFIRHGVPMRSAHEAVGKLVRECEQRRCRLIELPIDRFESVCPGQGKAVYQVLGVEKALAAFVSAGSTGPLEVETQLKVWQQKL